MGVARVWASRSLLPCRRSLLLIPVCACACAALLWPSLYSDPLPPRRTVVCGSLIHRLAYIQSIARTALPALHCTPTYPLFSPYILHTIRHRLHLHLHPHASATTLTTPAFPLFGRCPPACPAASAPSPSPTQADTAHAHAHGRNHDHDCDEALPRLYHHHHYPPPHRRTAPGTRPPHVHHAAARRPAHCASRAQLDAHH
jgi:hypothetical protein